LAGVIRAPVARTMKKKDKWIFFPSHSNLGSVEAIGQGKIRAVIELVFFKIRCGSKYRIKKENDSITSEKYSSHIKDSPLRKEGPFARIL